MPTGDIGTVIDTLEFDASLGRFPHIIHVSGDIFAIAYRGPGNNGWLATVDVSSVGAIADAVVDTLEFDALNCDEPRIIHVSGDIYAIAYTGEGSDGWLVTVDIDSAGNIGAAIIDSLEFDTSVGLEADIIHVSGQIYAIAYVGPGTDGWLCTVDIDSSGNIGAAVIDTLEFDATFCLEPNIIKVSGNIFAIAYRQATSPTAPGVITVEIETDGQIAAAITDSSAFAVTPFRMGQIIKISGTTYAIVFTDFSIDGWILTFTIANDGVIGSTIESLEFDTDQGNWPVISNVSGDVYAIAYSGPGGDGFITTLSVNSAGAIGAVIDTEEFDTFSCVKPSFVLVPSSSGIYAIAYNRANPYPGFLKTISVAVPTIGPTDALARVTGIRHIYRPGVLKMEVRLGDVQNDIEIVDDRVTASMLTGTGTGTGELSEEAKRSILATQRLHRIREIRALLADPNLPIQERTRLELELDEIFAAMIEDQGG